MKRTAPNQWIEDPQAIKQNQAVMAAYNLRVPNNPMMVQNLRQDPIYLRNLYGDAVFISQPNQPTVMSPAIQVPMGSGLNRGLPQFAQMQPPIYDPMMAEQIQAYFQGMFYAGAGPGGIPMVMPVRPNASMTSAMMLPGTPPPMVSSPTEQGAFNPMNVGSAQTKQRTRK
ncbi:hypothetical protein [Synechococcus elongatus]|uniref:hypothetical protein n=1 Tax=Synechococcus elongatus TaxID=32046 RepID=UPI000F7EEBE2|nr:hypothetical protein [Synechococcus elongatus]